MSTNEVTVETVARESKSLSAIEQQTLDFIHGYIKEVGFAPSVQDMCVAFKVTGTAVLGRLQRIERKGYIERSLRKARAIRLTPLGLESVGAQHA